MSEGDEIEFITVAGENIKLKVKSLINSKNNESLNEVNSGLDLIVKIPFEDFVGYTKEEIKTGLTTLAVAKKKKNISAVDKARINLDKESYKIEMGCGSEEKYLELKNELLKVLGK